jgi:hypothetical protein
VPILCPMIFTMPIGVEASRRAGFAQSARAPGGKHASSFASGPRSGCLRRAIGSLFPERPPEALFFGRAAGRPRQGRRRRTDGSLDLFDDRHSDWCDDRAGCRQDRYATGALACVAQLRAERAAPLPTPATLTSRQVGAAVGRDDPTYLASRLHSSG